MARIEQLANEDTELHVSAFARPKKSIAAVCARALCSIFAIIVLLAGVAFIVLRGGVQSDLLRDEAQKSLTHLLGEGAAVSIGSTMLSLDQQSLVALQAWNVSIDNPKRGILLKNIRTVRLGVAPIPLMTGKLRIAQFEVDGATFDMPEQKGKGFWKSLPYDDRGFVDFDTVSAVFFKTMNRSLELLKSQNTQEIGILNTTVRYKAGEEQESFKIVSARLFKKADSVLFNGVIEWKGEEIALNGLINHKPGEERLDDFSLTIGGIPVNVLPASNVAPKFDDNRVNPAHFEFHAIADLKITGHASDDDQPEHLSAQLAVQNIDMQLGRVPDVRGSAVLRMEHEVGSAKIEIASSDIELGGLKLQLNGAFGPEPVNESDQSGPAYRFEVISNSSSSMPAESSDPVLNFTSRVTGRFLIDEQRMQFSNLDVQTEHGQLYGQGSMGFGAGSPEIILLLRVPEMPVADAKHLWPIDVADGAREWVLKNLFGGILTDGRIDVSIPAGHFNGPGLPPPLTGEEVKVDFNIANTRFDVVGDLPPVRDADGTISVRGAHTVIKLKEGVAYTPNNRQASVSDGTLVIPWGPQRPVIATLDLKVSGAAAAIAEIVGSKPIDVMKSVPFTADDLSGNVQAHVDVDFAVTKAPPPGTLKWDANIQFNDLAIATKLGGSLVTDAKGSIKVDQVSAVINADAKLDGVPAVISMVEPVARTGPAKREQKIKLTLDDKARNTILPGMGEFFSGPMVIDLGMAELGKRHVSVDLNKTQISIPWLGWRKGAGVPAKANFDLIQTDDKKDRMDIKNLVFTGDAFGAKGELSIVDGSLQSANLSEVRLNRSDNVSVKVDKATSGYRISIRGSQFDARSLIKQFSSLDNKKDTTGNSKKGSAKSSIPRIVISAQIDRVGGFYDEILQNFAVSYERANNTVSGVSVNAVTSSGQSFAATNNEQGEARSISLKSDDAGAVLRFFDFYDKMRGGKITLGLAAQGKGPLSGQINATDFAIINEPRLAKLVSSPPIEGGQSLNQAVKKKIDVSRVDIERGYSRIEKGESYLNLSRGVIRGAQIGATFQGSLYNQQGDMAITGTFMPAYGLNRIFGEVPILGALLGNGRDRGLIGITFKLTGNAKHPQVIVNPISVIAPGIFRSIFEF